MINHSDPVMPRQNTDHTCIQGNVGPPPVQQQNDIAFPFIYIIYRYRINLLNQVFLQTSRILQEMNNAEIMQRAMDDFREVQEYMATAKEENATKTYAKLRFIIYPRPLFGNHVLSHIIKIVEIIAKQRGLYSGERLYGIC